MKRLFDIVFSVIGIIILFPLFLFLGMLILFGSGSPVFYKQKRVGKNFTEFHLVKFRTMVTGSDGKGLITVGDNDRRITSEGVFFRKFKLDELPQLFNILLGDMSFVGPRPEVKKYVDLYNEEQKKVLGIKPGLTDFASLEYFNESEILATYPDPEEAYREIIMPAKLKLNLLYARKQNIFVDIRIILKTMGRVLKNSSTGIDE
ncbi:MAG: sugar transferase [Bacteroidales bacterium]|nr:sugar transferase [Bacteroidales bacterium]